MRPTLDGEVIEEGIEAIKAGCADLITDNVMELCANAMRGVIIAPPGKKLVIADLSNIEGRVLAWLAGEEWKLQKFRELDTNGGPDLYEIGYGSTFGISPAEVLKWQRQIGKVIELFLGFEGGVGAFMTGAATYRIDLDSLNAEVPGDIWHEAENFYNWMVDMKRSTFGLKPETFMMCDAIKRLWRRANPKIASWWPELKDKTIAAIENPEEEIVCRKVRIVRRGNWLRIILPSGRSLSYPAPRVEGDTISYMGMNQYSRKWERLKTYGGKIAENITQAVARDVFKSSYPAILEAGYEIKLPVHDELICYAPDGALYGPKHLSQLMAVVPPWASGLPLAAAGFEAYRYRKD
jgi:DNA polymerase